MQTLKNSSPIIQLLLFAGIICAGLLVSYFFSAFFILSRSGFSLETIQNIGDTLYNSPNLLRAMQFFQIVTMFIFPAIICARLFSDDYKSYLRTDTPIDFTVWGLTIVSIPVAIPFLNLMSNLNQQMKFPGWLKGVEQWMADMENSQAEILEKMLQANDLWDLLFIILIIGVLTGIGEEFIFRGVLQNIFAKAIRNPHTVIWTVAFVFSAIHLQFYGFVPRLLLGAYLGYLLYYTQNIWTPVLAHFTNNSIGIILAYVFRDAPEKVKAIDAIGYESSLGWAFVSLTLFVFFFWKIRERRVEKIV
jgi:membrane protease YdiL (CAAX protease family)